MEPSLTLTPMTTAADYLGGAPAASSSEAPMTRTWAEEPDDEEKPDDEDLGGAPAASSSEAPAASSGAPAASSGAPAPEARGGDSLRKVKKTPKRNNKQAK